MVLQRERLDGGYACTPAKRFPERRFSQRKWRRGCQGTELRVGVGPNLPPVEALDTTIEPTLIGPTDFVSLVDFRPLVVETAQNGETEG